MVMMLMMVMLVDKSDVEGGDIDDYDYGWMCWK